MMYDIDLLKGRRRPIRSKPLAAVILGFSIIGPLLVFAGLFIHYDAKSSELHFVNKLGKSILERVSKISYEQEFNEAFKEQLGIEREAVSEIGTGADRFVQWTPKLREVVEKLPPTLAISEFDISTSSKKIREPIKGVSGKYVEREEVTRTLRMRLFSTDGDEQDKVVYEYLNVLRNSETFGADKDTLRIITFTTEEFSGIELPCYIVQCTYHSGWDAQQVKAEAERLAKAAAAEKEESK
ncbi:hypothetical protein SMSP2_02380 [Limihaloglobus sulfuriphilus]|uniref:Uncharacterized protein n=1 Tax=Limihaloglobus sulfuriphilus TaxID=1851148 RepID=A0A1Q2MH33_9BACT|nr:hypothetical protein [Limihaloglobus sulfuriphilus]AQQ72001.1 hypothetical protein SMSP2_02380 [Limihaloglobus sulfuriphilus]